MGCSAYAIGSAGFVDWVRDNWVLPSARSGNCEGPSKHRVSTPIDPEWVLSVLAEQLGQPLEVFRARRRNSPLRALAAGLLRKYSALTQREIAHILHMKTSAAVSVQLRKLPDWLDRDANIKRFYANAESELAKQPPSN